MRARLMHWHDSMVMSCGSTARMARAVGPCGHVSCHDQAGQAACYALSALVFSPLEPCIVHELSGHRPPDCHTDNMVGQLAIAPGASQIPFYTGNHFRHREHRGHHKYVYSGALLQTWDGDWKHAISKDRSIALQLTCSSIRSTQYFYTHFIPDLNHCLPQRSIAYIIRRLSRLDSRILAHSLLHYHRRIQQRAFPCPVTSCYDLVLTLMLMSLL